MSASASRSSYRRLLSSSRTIATARSAPAWTRSRVATSARIRSVHTKRTSGWLRRNAAARAWLRSSRRISARMALVSARSFTTALLRPPVEIVILVHGFVAHRTRQAADDRIRRIVAERGRRRPGRTPEVLVDRLANETGQRRPAPACVMAQLSVDLLRQPQDGCPVALHGDDAIPRYRLRGNSGSTAGLRATVVPAAGTSQPSSASAAGAGARPAPGPLWPRS